MAHAAAARSVEPSAPKAQALLFKPDRPREIDRYIDYFGGASDAHADETPDACGEAWLERPA
jgi:hypothetical protein